MLSADAATTADSLPAAILVIGHCAQAQRENPRGLRQEAWWRYRGGAVGGTADFARGVFVRRRSASALVQCLWRIRALAQSILARCSTFGSGLMLRASISRPPWLAPRYAQRVVASAACRRNSRTRTRGSPLL